MVESPKVSSAIFHPEVLNLPFLPHLRDRTKLSQIEASKDPHIQQALCILRSSEYQEAQSIPSRVCSVLEAARHSIATITPKANLRDVARFLPKEDHIKKMDDALEDLTVQGKFKDVVKLEEENKV